MMFLILKIFVYLVIALLLGGAAGFLLRQLKAQSEAEELQRNLQDAKSKIPQLESLLRARDERIRQLSKSAEAHSEATKGSRVQDEEHARQLREKEMELQRLRSRVASLEQERTDGLIDGEMLTPADPVENTAQQAAAQPAPQVAAQPALQAEPVPQATAEDGGAVEPAGETDDVLIVELHQEIERLKEELAGAAIALEVAQDNGALEQELRELRARLRQKAEDYERLQSQLEHEQRKVAELERERELQNKSLKVLHQQLEMAREAK
ncbi:MAG: hypothetical protein AAGI15_06160 [Pseudomonadota bacterium]